MPKFGSTLISKNRFKKIAVGGSKLYQTVIGQIWPLKSANQSRKSRSIFGCFCVKRYISVADPKRKVSRLKKPFDV